MPAEQDNVEEIEEILPLKIIFKLTLFNAFEGLKRLFDYSNAKFDSIIRVSDRYPTAVRIPIQAIQYLIGFITLISAGIADLLFLPNLPFVIMGLSELLVQPFTGRYVEAMTEYVERAISESQNIVINTFRNELIENRPHEAQQISKLTDEEIFTTYINAHPEIRLKVKSLKENEEEVRTRFTDNFNLNHHGVQKIKFVAIAFYQAIMDFEDMSPWKWIKKPLQALAAIIIIPTLTITELVKYIVVPTFYGILAIEGLTAAIPLLLLNTPIYLSDALKTNELPPAPGVVPSLNPADDGVGEKDSSEKMRRLSSNTNEAPTPQQDIPPAHQTGTGAVSSFILSGILNKGIRQSHPSREMNNQIETLSADIQTHLSPGS